MRVFLAIEIPQNIKEKLVEVQEELKSYLPNVRWESSEKLHITLVFLGEVPEERIADLKEVVRKGVKARLASLRSAESRRGIKGINVGFSGMGVFPSEKRPRVVLVEVGDGRREIERLQKRLAEALSEKGFNFARLSQSHVTLGRFKRGAQHTRRVCKKVGDGTGFEVKEVVIVESKLHPAGAIHTPITRIPLC